jgi:hypothetical protein
LKDLPYDALLTIFLYIPGVRTVAALQNTCRRCFQIGSEEDYIWRKQLEAFYPTLSSSSAHNAKNPFFIGYYYLIRNHVSEKKTKAMSKLVNELAENPKVAATKANSREVEILFTCSEINLRYGACLGPNAALLLKGFDRHFLLDTLDLGGMLLRQEGLEHLRDVAKAGHLPFLKTLGLRENKLGVGGPSTVAACGNALAEIMKSCNELTSIDLSENFLLGSKGIKALLEPMAAVADRLPTRLMLNNNQLGVKGASWMLGKFSDYITSSTRRGRKFLPILISLENTGLGYNFDEMQSSARSATDAPRASIDDCVLLMESIFAYTETVMSVACSVAKSRLEDRKKRRGGSSSKKSLNDLSKEALVETCLSLQDDPSVNQQQTSSSSSAFTTVTPTTSPFNNALPFCLRDEMPKKSPQAAQGLGMRLHNGDPDAPKGSPGRGGPVSRPVQTHHELFKDNARFVFTWPKFNAPEPSSSCVIC